MTPREKIDFLQAKRKLVQPLIEKAEAQVVDLYFAKLEAPGLDAIPPASLEEGAHEIDRKLEKLMVEWVLDEDVAAIRATLKQQFGLTSFEEQPDKVLKRVLREKQIRNEEEARLVSDFLAGSYLGWDADDKKVKQFNEILGAYESRRAR